MTSTSPSRSASIRLERSPATLARRQRDGPLGPRADEQGHRLRLGEVEAAIDEGAARELSGLGQPRPLGDQPLDQHPGQRRAAVAGDLDGVLARVGARGAHHRAQGIVDDIAGSRVDQGDSGEPVRLQIDEGSARADQRRGDGERRRDR